jgi:hypothetical protein
LDSIYDTLLNGRGSTARKRAAKKKRSRKAQVRKGTRKPKAGDKLKSRSPGARHEAEQPRTGAGRHRSPKDYTRKPKRPPDWRLNASRKGTKGHAEEARFERQAIHSQSLDRAVRTSGHIGILKNLTILAIYQPIPGGSLLTAVLAERTPISGKTARERAFSTDKIIRSALKPLSDSYGEQNTTWEKEGKAAGKLDFKTRPFAPLVMVIGGTSKGRMELNVGLGRSQTLSHFDPDAKKSYAILPDPFDPYYLTKLQAALTAEGDDRRSFQVKEALFRYLAPEVGVPQSRGRRKSPDLQKEMEERILASKVAAVRARAAGIPITEAQLKIVGKGIVKIVGKEQAGLRYVKPRAMALKSRGEMGSPAGPVPVGELVTDLSEARQFHMTGLDRMMKAATEMYGSGRRSKQYGLSEEEQKHSARRHRRHKTTKKYQAGQEAWWEEQMEQARTKKNRRRYNPDEARNAALLQAATFGLISSTPGDAKGDTLGQSILGAKLTLRRTISGTKEDNFATKIKGYAEKGVPFDPKDARAMRALLQQASASFMGTYARRRFSDMMRGSDREGFLQLMLDPQDSELDSREQMLEGIASEAWSAFESLPEEQMDRWMAGGALYVPQHTTDLAFSSRKAEDIVTDALFGPIFGALYSTLNKAVAGRGEERRDLEEFQAATGGATFKMGGKVTPGTRFSPPAAITEGAMYLKRLLSNTSGKFTRKLSKGGDPMSALPLLPSEYIRTGAPPAAEKEKTRKREEKKTTAIATTGTPHQQGREEDRVEAELDRLKRVSIPRQKKVIAVAQKKLLRWRRTGRKSTEVEGYTGPSYFDQLLVLDDAVWTAQHRLEEMNKDIKLRRRQLRVLQKGGVLKAPPEGESLSMEDPGTYPGEAEESAKFTKRQMDEYEAALHAAWQQVLARTSASGRIMTQEERMAIFMEMFPELVGPMGEAAFSSYVQSEAEAGYRSKATEEALEAMGERGEAILRGETPSLSSRQVAASRLGVEQMERMAARAAKQKRASRGARPSSLHCAEKFSTKSIPYKPPEAVLLADPDPDGLGGQEGMARGEAKLVVLRAPPGTDNRFLLYRRGAEVCRGGFLPKGRGPAQVAAAEAAAINNQLLWLNDPSREKRRRKVYLYYGIIGDPYLRLIRLPGEPASMNQVKELLDMDNAVLDMAKAGTPVEGWEPEVGRPPYVINWTGYDPASPQAKAMLAEDVENYRTAIGLRGSAAKPPVSRAESEALASRATASRAQKKEAVTGLAGARTSSIGYFLPKPSPLEDLGYTKSRVQEMISNSLTYPTAAGQMGKVLNVYSPRLEIFGDAVVAAVMTRPKPSQYTIRFFAPFGRAAKGERPGRLDDLESYVASLRHKGGPEVELFGEDSEAVWSRYQGRGSTQKIAADIAQRSVVVYVFDEAPDEEGINQNILTGIAGASILPSGIIYLYDGVGNYEQPAIGKRANFAKWVASSGIRGATKDYETFSPSPPTAMAEAMGKTNPRYNRRKSTRKARRPRKPRSLRW